MYRQIGGGKKSESKGGGGGGGGRVAGMGLRGERGRLKVICWC